MLDQKQLLNIITDIGENYKNEELFYRIDRKSMPNRDEIIHIIMALRQIMFPGYFDAERVSRQTPEYFLGHNMIRLYDKLSQQITYAMIHESNDNITNEEIKGKVDTICDHFFEKLPQVQSLLMKDVQAGFDGDPAAKSKEEIIYCYPGLFAIFVYRIAHILYEEKVPFIPRIMSEYAHDHTGIDINPGAKIGEYFFIDHGTGIVIGETTVIGNNVKIYQGVTLGALSTRSGQLLRDVKRHPTIEDHVTIYSNASILGGETVIGKDCVIGGSAFITESIPAGTRVIVSNPELIFTEKTGKESDLYE